MFDKYSVFGILAGMVLGGTISVLVPEPAWLMWLLVVIVCGSVGVAIGSLR